MPFTPPNLTNLSLWLDASNSGSIISAATLVSQWNDLSGNGFNATQSTSLNKPITGIKTINGLNAIYFGPQANGCFMSLPSGMFTISNGPNTCFVVIKQNSITGTYGEIFGGDVAGDSGYELGWRSTGTGTFNNNNSSSVSYDYVGPAQDATNAHIVGFNRNGTTINAFYDSATSTGSGQTNCTLQEFPIGIFTGDTTGMDSYIGEIIIYSQSLNPTNQATVMTYLTSKWLNTPSVNSNFLMFF